MPVAAHHEEVDLMKLAQTNQFFRNAAVLEDGMNGEPCFRELAADGLDKRGIAPCFVVVRFLAE